jgi:hypothetical protein
VTIQHETATREPIPRYGVSWLVVPQGAYTFTCGSNFSMLKRLQQAYTEGDTEVSSMGRNRKIIFGISGAALGVLLLVASMMGGGMGDRGAMMGPGMMAHSVDGVGAMMGGGMMGGGFSGMLLMLLFWAIVIALLVTLLTWVLNQRQRR